MQFILKYVRWFFAVLPRVGTQLTGCVIQVINLVVLTPVYFLGVGFTSLVAKIVGRHFLALNRENKATYWVEKKNKPIGMNECQRQF